MLDQLTSALNKGVFEELLELEGKRSLRYSEFLAVLAMEPDIEIMDKNLKSFAEIIRRAVRNTDLLGRIDRQLFSIILHHADGEEAYKVARRIQNCVASYGLVCGERNLNMTISIGGACFPTDTSTISTLLCTARTMLSLAKSRGPNKVYFPDGQNSRKRIRQNNTLFQV